MILDSSDSLVTGIKRSTSDSNLDQMFGYSADEVENTSTIEVVGSGNIDKAYLEFKNYLDSLIHFELSFDKNLVLTPIELNVLMGRIKDYSGHINYEEWSHVFIDKLFKNSYDHGNRKFALIIDLPKINSFLNDLTATEEKPFEFNVEGDLPWSAFSSCKNVIANITGDVDAYFGFKSSDCKFIINGNVSNNAFRNSNHLDISVNGDVGNNFAFGNENLNVNIKGEIGSSFGWKSKNSNYVVEGDITYNALSYAIDSSIRIKGNVDEYFGPFSNNLFAIIEGDVRMKFGSQSTNMKSFIKGNVGANLGIFSNNFTAGILGYVFGAFGRGTNDLLVAVDGNVNNFYNDGLRNKVYVSKNNGTPNFNLNVVLGEDATTNPEYIKLMQELDLEMKKLEGMRQ